MTHARTFTALALLCAATLAALAPADAYAAYAAPIAINRPGWAQTAPWDLNDSGQVVGGNNSADFSVGTGFLLTNGVYTSIAPAGAAYSGATGISNSGLIVGYYFDDPNAGASRGFLFENGVYTDFTLAGASDVILRRVSSDGRYLAGTFTDLSGFHGFVFDRQTQARTVIDSAGASAIVVQGVSVQGQVVGSTLGRGRHAFVYDLNTHTETPYLGTDAGASPRFRDINDNGLITGFDGPSGLAFVGRAGDWTFLDLPAGQASMLGYGLNNAGTVVGWTSDADGLASGFLAQPAPVPEPAPALLLAFGLAAAALVSRRKPLQARASQTQR